MQELICRIEFFSDWHAGSGLAAGADLDLLVIKDRDGFPFLPGKTLKGLLKDVALELKDNNAVTEEFVDKLFGKNALQGEESQELGHKASTPSEAFFSDATLTEHLKSKLAGKKQTLYRKIASTAIEENGQAKEHSLRRIEVTVPLVLFAKVNFPDKLSFNDLEKCGKMVKRLGSGRNRGLGRCSLRFIKGDLK